MPLPLLIGRKILFYNKCLNNELQGLLVVLVFVIIARPIPVLSCLLPDHKARWELYEILFLFWTRKTGVIAAALVGIVGAPAWQTRS
ncbi:hypothetical protein EL26_06540 [Tumebacillus flagellatus]|uniref:Cation/H+ exchanger domain-containing protein n=1 Tax=Tumebacillus flagellatus TaxID=1157490 RepID=A0A074MEA5_9BACL|nr:hypothetical protein EL26_06540 [Tumebacillus flagellatus]